MGMTSMPRPPDADIRRAKRPRRSQKNGFTPSASQTRKDIAVRGLEVAFWGTLGGDPELKISKSEKRFAVFNVAVTVGHDDDGKDVTQWVRVACFGQIAEEVAGRAAKGDRVYVEGSLTMNTWKTAAGERRSGLNVAAWKAEKLAAIGTNR
jgi:single stranded DNA-binding protein